MVNIGGISSLIALLAASLGAETEGFVEKGPFLSSSSPPSRQYARTSRKRRLGQLIIDDSASSQHGSCTISLSATSASTATTAHTFWQQERSKAEVEEFIYDTLEDVDSQQKRQQPKADRVGGSSVDYHRHRADQEQTVEVVSNEPPLVVIHNFLSSQMCDEIVDTALATERLKASTCGEEQNRNSDTRSSTTAWLTDAECPQPSRLIASKVSKICGLPASYMENLQVVRYLPGQEFQLHTDHQNSFNELECRGRLATCLVYLAEPGSGGETWFPGLTAVDDGDGYSNASVPTTDGTKDTLVSPRKGSAVFFWNTLERPGSPGYAPTMDLQADWKLRHAGLPVEQGAKWVCNRWVHPVDYGDGVQGL